MAYNPGIQPIGGQLIGQGLQQLGQGIGQGIREYKQNKLMASQGVAMFEAAAANNKDLLQYLESENANKDAKAAYKKFKTGGLGFRDAATLAHFAQSYVGQKQQAQMMQLRQQEAQAAQAQQAQLLKDQAALSRSISPTGNFDLRSYVQFGGSIPGLKQMGFDVDKAMSAQGQQGRVMTQEEVEGLAKKGIDAKATPLPDGNFMVKEVSPFAPAASTTINMGNRMKQTAYETLQKSYVDTVEPIISSSPDIAAMKDLLEVTDDSGVITGAFANLELGAKSWANKIGLGNFKDVAATQAYVGNAAVALGQIIKQFGAGTGLSDADREIANKAVGGDIKMDKAALKSLVRSAEKVMKKRVSEYNARIEKTFKGDDEDAVFARDSLLIPEENLGPMLEEAKEQPKETPKEKVPANVPPELWNAMTPEEKALWN